MMSLLQQIEASGFSQWVKQSGSLWAFPGILLMHTYGMAILVGIITGIDLRILGLMPAVPLGPLRRFFPLVWIAFWVNAITGTMLLAADAKMQTYSITSPPGDNAVSLLQQAQRLDPNNPIADEMLAKAYGLEQQHGRQAADPDGG